MTKIIGSDNATRFPSPGASYERCDWCGRDKRRWDFHYICTDCVVVPPEAYSKHTYNLSLWGLACATHFLLGFLMGWVL